MSFKLQILSRSSKKWFDITPVAGTRKARKRLRAFFVFQGVVGLRMEVGRKLVAVL